MSYLKKEIYLLTTIKKKSHSINIGLIIVVMLASAISWFLTEHVVYQLDQIDLVDVEWLQQSKPRAYAATPENGLVAYYKITGNAIVDDCADVVGLWHFDGNANDGSGNGNDGTVNGATLTTGKLGQGYDFDGVDDYVGFNRINLDDSMTLTGWIKREGNDGILGIDNPNQYNRLSFFEDKLFFEFNDSGAINVNLVFNQGEWLHFAFVREADGIVNFYLDGVLGYTSPSPYSGQTYWERIGSSGPKSFNGSMDEVVIWDKALTSSEISQLYNSGNGVAVSCSGSPPPSSGSCDADGDGYDSNNATCGGSDCDDANSGINPGASETCGNTIDEDCSGSDLVCTTYQCSDGVDNDGDGLIDYPNDPGCLFNLDDDETNVVQTSSNQLLAFPGAEGFGAYTKGGRGGSVYIIDTLSDNPADGMTFREAVTATGPRIIVFNVSGYIDLESQLKVHNPYLTIAGQTSPGGISIVGHDLWINTHEVIITHMRFRSGTKYVDYERDGEGNILYFDFLNTFQDGITSGNCVGNSVSTPPTHPKGSKNTHPYPCPLVTGVDPSELHAIVFVGKRWDSNDAYNMIVDHSSFSYGVDETVAITGGIENMTFSNNIVSSGLNFAGHSKGGHSKGLMVATYGMSPKGNTTSISIFRNYIAHSGDRMPLVAALNNPGTSVIADVVNNVVYDWYGASVGITWGAPKINWVNNYMKPGAYYSWFARELTHEPQGAIPQNVMYVKGNIGSTRLSQSEDDWNVGVDWSNKDLSKELWGTDVRHPAPTINEATMSDDLANSILQDVGATKPVRDSLDQQFVDDFAAGTGSIPVNVEYPQDYPTFQNPAPPVDSDSDGMSDAWETTIFGDLSKSNNGDEDGDGYTNIEEYLHYLAGDVFSTPPPTSTCTSWTYSDWLPLACPESETQTREITSSSPSGCAGGSPITSQSCTYVPTDTSPPIIFNVQSGAINTNLATVSWTTDESSDSKVEYGLTSNYSQSTILNNSLVTSHSVDLIELSDNTTYNFRVISIDISGNIGQSINYTFTTSPATNPDVVPPSAINDLAGSNVSRTSADLSWTAPGDDGSVGTAASYDIGYSTSSITNTNWNAITEVSGEPTPQSSGSDQYISVGLSPGTTYYFAMKALDEAGNISDISNVISFTTLAETVDPPSSNNGGGGGGTTVDIIPPSQPSNFTVQGAESQINLSWVNPTDSDFVRVKVVRAEGENCPSTHNDSNAVLVYEGVNEEYADIKLDNNTNYCYAIFAYDKKPNIILFSVLRHQESVQSSR